MPLRRPILSRLRPDRGLIAAVALLGQLAPLAAWPAPSAGKDLSRPFPCMDHPCGCRNADECWHQCCCFTQAEKVAWAEAHGVEVPAFVRAAAAVEAKGWNQPRQRDRDSGVKGGCACCRSGCCSHHGAESGCCSLAAPAPAPNRDEANPEPPVRWQSFTMARHCRGSDPSGLMGLLPSGLPATAPLTWSPRFDCVGRCPLADSRLSPRPASPPIPPPRPA